MYCLCSLLPFLELSPISRGYCYPKDQQTKSWNKSRPLPILSMPRLLIFVLALTVGEKRIQGIISAKRMSCLHG